MTLRFEPVLVDIPLDIAKNDSFLESDLVLAAKAPAGGARAAARAGVPVVAVAGVCTLTSAELEAAGLRAAYALSAIERDLDRCVLEAGPLLERVAATSAADTLIGAAV